MQLSPVPKHFLKNDTIEPVSYEITEFFRRLNRTFCEDFLVLIPTPIHKSEGDIRESYQNIKISETSPIAGFWGGW